MAKSSLKLNNLICFGLIFSISAVFSIATNGLNDLIPLLFSIFVGVDFCQSARGFLNERTVAFCSYFFSLYGFFSDLFWHETPLHYISAVFLGIGMGGLYFIFSRSFFYYFCNGENLKKRTELRTIIALLPAFCLSVWTLVKYSNGISILLLSVIGLISCYCIATPCETIVEPYEKEHKIYKKNRRKINLFFLIIAFSNGLILAISSQSQAFQMGLQYIGVFLTGIVTGPAITLLLVNKKGIYSGCILLIFLAEISLMCTTLYNHLTYGPLIGNFAYGLLLTATLTLSPILTYYMLGPSRFSENYARSLKTIIIGLLPILPLTKLPPETLNSTELTLVAIFLLLCGFFTVFSAWSHRLVLLK